jgi:Uma2 family endonuclease
MRMTMAAVAEEPYSPQYENVHYDKTQPPTVDLLFEVDDSAERHEVLRGKLHVSPALSPGHNLVVDRLRILVERQLPADVEGLTASAIRMPDGDGAIPDVILTTANPEKHPKGIPFEAVHTVIEVVSPRNAGIDRRTKRQLYADAGIPCYWRIELRGWKDHKEPVPAIVVALRGEHGRWKESIHPAGTVARLPMAVSHDGMDQIMVKIDPATLVGRRGARPSPQDPGDSDGR